MKSEYVKGILVIKWKLKRWWATISPISTRRTITSHLLNTNKKSRFWVGQASFSAVGERHRKTKCLAIQKIKEGFTRLARQCSDKLPCFCSDKNISNHEIDKKFVNMTENVSMICVFQLWYWFADVGQGQQP
jgi:hypothetical protein